MKNLFYVLLFTILSPSIKGQTTTLISIENPVSITKNFMSFWEYYNDHINLSEDFISLDEKGKPMSNKKFVEKLSSGKYLPLSLRTKDKPCYQLYVLSSNISKDITATIIQCADRRLSQISLEGKPLPHFNFVDLQGNRYDKKTMKGKFVVIKCWFIACGACVKEMPQLNTMVEKYKIRKDVAFVSLAFDDEPQLKRFLTKKAFKYAVVANKEAYMDKELRIRLYPTHLIVDKNGRVFRVLEDIDFLGVMLERCLKNS